MFEVEVTAGEKAAVKLVPEEPGTERQLLFTDLDGVRDVGPVIDIGWHETQRTVVTPVPTSPCATTSGSSVSCP
ncbi:hypothetical protein [Streptomyces sp. NPDC058739]|uniref:hypothetical protein n=1 Tax=Streptomyces sp. NPDC058739 TaxID=3346618 RepID=UPI0036CAFEE3